MKNIDEEKLLSILLEQGLINEAQEQAYLTYQEEYERRTGERAPSTRVLEKLDILSPDQIASVLKAFESTSAAPKLPIPSGSQSIETALGERPSPKIAPSKIFTPSPEDDEEEETEKGAVEKSSPTPKLSAAFTPLMPIPPLPTEKPSTEKLVTPIMPERSHVPLIVEKPTASALTTAKPQPVEKPKVEERDESKCALVAYFLLLCFGFLGAHRFYLRYYRSGFLYLFTFGFLGLGIALDIFLLPWLVINYRRSLQSADKMASAWQELQACEHYQHSAAVPPWVPKHTTFQKLINFFSMFLQIIYLFIAPLLLGLVAVLAWQPLLPLVLVVWSTIFLGNIGLSKKFAENSGWRHIPFLPLFSQKIAQFTGLYFTNKPYGFLIYLLYPLWLPLAILFGHKRRLEALCHLWIMLPGIFLIAAGIFYHFWTVSFQYTALTERLLSLQAAIWMASFLLLLMFAMPLFTTLASFRLKQHEKSAKFFAGWFWLVQVAVLGLLVVGPHFLPWESYSHQYALRRVATKLQLPEYRDQLKTMITAFETVVQNRKSEYRQELAIEYTKTLQRWLQGTFPLKEAQLFKISYLSNEAIMVLYAGPHPLAVWDSNCKFIRTWDGLKEGDVNYQEPLLKQQAQFVVCPYVEEYRAYLDMPMPLLFQKASEQPEQQTSSKYLLDDLR